MNIPNSIYNCLKERGEVTILNFGVFKLENSTALLDPETGTLLPPANLVVFSKITNSETSFIDFLAQENSISQQEAQQVLMDEITLWNKKISEGKSFELLQLGKFEYHKGEIEFEGKRIEKNHPDFFGLDKIVISEIQETPNSKKERSSRNTIWVWFVMLILFLGVSYLAYFEKEMFFGKESLIVAEPIKKNSTQKSIIADSVVLKKDSTKIETDSLPQIKTTSNNGEDKKSN